MCSGTSPHCDYLLGKLGARNYVPQNFSFSPFKLYSRSKTTEIQAGSPVEDASSQPFSTGIQFLFESLATSN
ncbi:hypothetical protein RRG08_000701 [Elysia crispata]|uniref:Uncharacterized protein n=1 Tax=Elysia crispata TaxID=231223 RepID=A0AAE1E6I3_9GAST|nr:hypothetical protein RRG08_000701 [Elysia crispata]